MASKHLRLGTWILVADGKHALVLRTADVGPPPVLRVVKSHGHHKPPAGEQATGNSGNQQSESEFLVGIVRDLETELRKGQFSTLVIAAAPNALGIIRKEMSAQLRNCTVVEIPKDFTNLPQDQLPDAIAKALAGHGGSDEAA